MITVTEYWHVLYNHKSGSKGVMGQKHTAITGAIDQITFLLDDKVHSKDRKYYIQRVKETVEREDIAYPVAL